MTGSNYPHASAGYGYIAPAPAGKPTVLTWFVVYAIAMSAMYVVVAIVGVVLIVGPSASAADANEAQQLYVTGVMLLIVAIPLALVFAVAPFLPRKPWAWVYDLVLIGVGMTSACLLPAAIPLLIFWIKPQTKAWFGR